MTPESIADFVVQGLQARNLTSSPELQNPPPMTREEVEQYCAMLRGMPLKRLKQESFVLESAFSNLEPALPDWRLGYSTYPHPVIQRRLLVLNELYRRSITNPVKSYNQLKTETTLEWGAAGAIVGGIVGKFVTGNFYVGVASGAVLGAVAGRSTIVQQLLTEISTGLVL